LQISTETYELFELLLNRREIFVSPKTEYKKAKRHPAKKVDYKIQTLLSICIFTVKV